jgi:hypothetical protein
MKEENIIKELNSLKTRIERTIVNYQFSNFGIGLSLSTKQRNEIIKVLQFILDKER